MVITISFSGKPTNQCLAFLQSKTLIIALTCFNIRLVKSNLRLPILIMVEDIGSKRDMMGKLMVIGLGVWQEIRFSYARVLKNFCEKNDHFSQDVLSIEERV